MSPLGGFTAVAIAFGVALIVGWVSIGSVSSTIQRGYERAVTSTAASAAAYTMHVSPRRRSIVLT